MSERTKAVVVMHYAGDPAATEQIVASAHARGVKVIEDAAHAPVVQADGGMLGTLGDIGCFSFFATKNMTTGEGGMVVARDPDLLSLIRAMRSHCVSRSTWQRLSTGPSGYDVPALGLNYRPTEISSAIGRVQLARLDTDRLRRRQLVTLYRRLLSEIPGVVVPSAAGTRASAHHLMTVLLPAGVARAAVQEELHVSGVQTSVHYPPTHQLSHYRDDPVRRRVAHPRERLPVVERVADRLLTLPLHSRMSESDAEFVVERLAATL